MAKIILTPVPPQSAKSDDAKRTRGTSGTAHPYFDLDSSIKVPEAIHAKGGGACTADQLALWLGYSSIRSGTYLTRMAAAKQFGLIQSSGGGFSITDRARAILSPIMPEDRINAKVAAFLNVELFSKVYEQFHGTALPPEQGIKNLFASTYKILPDRVPQATRVFLSSATQAGLANQMGDRIRLVLPSTTGNGTTAAPAPVEEEIKTQVQEKPKGGGGSGTGGGDGPPGVHFAIIGLLRELPPAGTAWSAQKKKRFLDAFRATVDFIYPEEEAQ
jgi:hypothetical protein